MKRLVGWLVVLRIYVALAVFQPYRDLEAGDNQSLKIQVARPEIQPRSSFAPQAKSLTTRPPLLPHEKRMYKMGNPIVITMFISLSLHTFL